jgi:hypothetical protein
MKWQRYLAWEDTELLSFDNCIEEAKTKAIWLQQVQFYIRQIKYI